MPFPSDLEIARKANLKPITEISKNKLGITDEFLVPFGHHKAKIQLEALKKSEGHNSGNLILVSAITPTPAGEGKTTTTVGLVDGLNAIGKKAIGCLREPSLGPCFGIKGGAAGGGYSQVVPMEDINLHFTGDIHAVSSAHNLLSALIDNYIYWANEKRIDLRRINWKRVVDMNDRSLRSITVGLGGYTNGFPRQDGYDITVASEVMAILCLASDINNLQERLGNINIGETRIGEFVFAKDIGAHGSMTALLKDAILPNLVQTLENNPVFIHGGPFANIAHGCNSVLATKAALNFADYVVTEAGFGADLGAEKFLNIKCRKAGLNPKCVVLVATIRALKMHGGVELPSLKQENLEALKIGFSNLDQHINNLKKFNLPVVVSINHFSSDTDSEVNCVLEHCQQIGVKACVSKGWELGGEGCTELASAVSNTVNSNKADFNFLYPDDMPLYEKIKTIAKEIYGAADIFAEKKIIDKLKKFESHGFGHYPICIAKTQYSFSVDPKLRGAPKGHVVPIQDVKLSSGAEFVVAYTSDIMTMPGLSRRPSAYDIFVDATGEIQGLF